MSFTCRVCDQSFQSGAHLDQHTREDNNHSTLVWRCENLCGRAFEAYDDLCRHKQTAPLHHVLDAYTVVYEWTLDEGLRCRECDKFFDDVTSLYHHLKDSPQHNLSEADLRPPGSMIPTSREVVREAVARLRRGIQEQLDQDGGASPSPSGPQPTQEPTTGSCPADTTTTTAAAAITTITTATAATSAQLFGPPTLEEAFNTMAANFAAMEAKLQTTTEELKATTEELKAATDKLQTTSDELEHQESLHRCGMCYESQVNCVGECGHQFCIECVQGWFDSKASRLSHPANLPCPMCRSPMGKVIRTYTCEV